MRARSLRVYREADQKEKMTPAKTGKNVQNPKTGRLIYYKTPKR